MQIIEKNARYELAKIGPREWGLSILDAAGRPDGFHLFATKKAALEFIGNLKTALGL